MTILPVRSLVAIIAIVVCITIMESKRVASCNCLFGNDVVANFPEVGDRGLDVSLSRS